MCKRASVVAKALVRNPPAELSGSYISDTVSRERFINPGQNVCLAVGFYNWVRVVDVDLFQYRHLFVRHTIWDLPIPLRYGLLSRF